MGDEKPYSEMSLEELVDLNNRLWDQRQALKAQQAELQPYLDAAWEAKSKADAAKGDPALAQGIG